MTRYWPNSQITYQTQIKNNGALVTPTTITFKWKIGRCGAWTTVTPTALSTGVYAVYITPTYGGPLYWMWQATGPAIQDEGMTMIESSNFNSQSQSYDYGFGPYYYG